MGLIILMQNSPEQEKKKKRVGGEEFDVTFMGMIVEWLSGKN